RHAAGEVVARMHSRLPPDACVRALADRADPAWSDNSNATPARPPQTGRGYPGSDATPQAPQAGHSVAVVDSRNEIREFLATRRAKLSPQQAGIPFYSGRRRVPGLR